MKPTGASSIDRLRIAFLSGFLNVAMLHWHWICEEVIGTPDAALSSILPCKKGCTDATFLDHTTNTSEPHSYGSKQRGSASMRTAAALLPGAQGNHPARPWPSDVLLNDFVYSTRYDIVPKTRSMDLINCI